MSKYTGPPFPTDTQLLDWLQSQLDKHEYTGACLFRWSTTGRGWRLHETTDGDAVAFVRMAIRDAMLREQQKGAKR